MASIHTNPRKTKPSWLTFPCTICNEYEEDESSLDPVTKALWNNQGLPDSNRCRYNPMLADPDEREKCPYKHLLGQTIIGLYCDMCGKDFEYLEPTDPRLEMYIRDPFHIDICPACQLLKDKNLTQKRVITLLGESK